jgi:hypothetical protein
MVWSQVWAVRDSECVDGGMLQGYLHEFQGEVGYVGLRRRPADNVTFLCMLRTQDGGNPADPPQPRRADSGWDNNSVAEVNEDDAQLHVPELDLAGLDPTTDSAMGEKDTTMNKKRVKADGYGETLKAKPC